jgi:hypothetical protein
MSKEASRVSAENGPQPPYGTAIQNAIAAGDLAKMKAVARQAEQYLAKQGDVSAALEALKIEIAKIEARSH